MHLDRTVKSGPGAAGFPHTFWCENYAEPETMDGIYNARRRAKALHALFHSEYIEISSLIDLGFGLGYLFKEMIDVFMPLTAVGIEPSTHAFERVRSTQLTAVETVQVSLEQIDIVKWGESVCPWSPFDLGICTSVFQYLSDPEIESILPTLSERVRYLYFSVPTDRELQFLMEEFDFTDQYAYRRSRDEYRTMLRDHFTIVSNRLLESKVHFSESTTEFTDFFYRF